MALSMPTVAACPADENHAYGHGKAEYFSSGFEAALINLAVALVLLRAGRRRQSVTLEANAHHLLTDV